MNPRALLLAALLAPGGFSARAETAHGGAGESAAPVEPGVMTVPLNVAGVDYAAEITEPEAAPADLRLRRADGASMADLGYLVAELAVEACRGVGLRFDAGLPAILGADGSWEVAGGCR